MGHPLQFQLPPALANKNDDYYDEYYYNEYNYYDEEYPDGYDYYEYEEEIYTPVVGSSQKSEANTEVAGSKRAEEVKADTITEPTQQISRPDRRNNINSNTAQNTPKRNLKTKKRNQQRKSKTVLKFFFVNLI